MHTKLVITIDTEEDNWGNYARTGWTVENITQIPSLQNLFDRFNVLPTYLLTYPVASDERGVSILKTICENGRCEIGAHCHPWNTPPFDEANTEANSLLSNLPLGLVNRKLETLHQAIEKAFNVVPVSFRAGRWGYSNDLATALYKLGYKVDTSIIPLTGWAPSGFQKVRPEPYYFKPKNDERPSSTGGVLEVPATVGLRQRNTPWAYNLLAFLEMEPMKRLRLVGVLDRLNLLNRIWLSPELCGVEEMIALTRRLLKQNVSIINLYFHSPTLKPGLTPYVRSEADKDRFLRRIEEFLEFSQGIGIESIQLSDSVKVVAE